MPLATIHLISLSPSTTLPDFLAALKSSPVKPLVISKVIRWVITPTKIDAEPLLHPKKPWDLLLIVLGTDPLPETLKNKIVCHWHCSTGIPSRLTNDFPARNDRLLHPPTSEVPALTGSLDNPRLGSSSQTLELSNDLQSWISQFSRTTAGKSPLSMLNLLAFKSGMKPSYLKYGAAFAESIGSRRGGNAKLVGNITSQTPQEQSGGKWDEFALASYPSIMHFADMLASQDYQAVNLKYRVPALEDTFILCTSEIEIEDLVRGQGNLGIGRRAMGGKL
ncbi:uncharacterized protein Z520_06674 [Fonsecaea multimorphosa CBS 102226]|uniref:DUF1330 domain-containing protein n=1 Tax=Fonsecaea multimorphosa CBS 102226 TaxID=1442371 RepID=A0A0D2ILN1_9EURO|nr:uncharacterized protein Z520_06674 [Fonsecaea multimorphosa CBS 102226]KIX97896.1 hypothetical protein Z520_06674 [Fonsecaea multimorphosa CBS 102226]OAL23666.1 hypothetical protein AYO22_06243 [Fonsecaea multimorphosa]